MEGSRDTSQSLHSSDELEDDSGLELSLGLSCGGLRNKCKASEGATAVDFTSEHGTGGVGDFEKPKYVRRSGLDAALKKFLERRLDEQEDSGRLLDGFSHQEGAWLSNGSVNKEQERHISVYNVGSLGSPATKGYQEKTDQLLMFSDLESRGNVVLSKDIHRSAGVATGWGQLAEQAAPLLFMDALKAGSLGDSTALMHHFAEAQGHEAEDKGELQRQAMLQQHDGLEQQKKFQEARKKRKDLIEEQKQQKKLKKEDDRIGPHGFRRPGSNTWVHGSDATAPALDVEKTLLGPHEGQEGEQFQQESRGRLQLERVRADTERSSEAEQYESNGIPDDDSKGVEMYFMPQLKPQDVGKFSFAGNGELSGVPEDAWHLRIMQTRAAVNEPPGRMAATKGALITPSSHQEEESTALSCGRPGSPSKRESTKASCESISTGTDSSEKKEEQSCGEDGEASSAPPVTVGSDAVAASTNTFPPSPLASFSVMPMPYSVRAPTPKAPGLPSVGFSFPYLMQYSPPISDGQEQSSEQPVTSSTFQLPSGHGYPSLQTPALEGTPWMQGLRPPTASPFITPNSRVIRNWTSTGLVEEDNSRPQGAKVHENGSGQNVTSAADISAVEKQTLYRAVSVNCALDPAVTLSQSYQASDLQSLSSLPVSVVPHFGPMRTLSDPGELRLFKEQGGINAFPGFAASVQAAQGLPGASRPPSNRVEEGGARQEQTKLSGKADSAALQQVARTEDTNTTESKDLGQEDMRRSFAGQFHQGNTDNLPMSDGLAKELVNLRPGIPPWLKFGGTGSSPDLPWVSTTGSGPNGRTVCGVLYRFSRTQVQIVCACHGKHMSPSEFVQHGGGMDVSNPEKNIVVNPFHLTT